MPSRPVPLPEAPGLRPSLGALAGAGLGLLVALAYPLAMQRILDAWGARAAGGAVLAVGLVSLPALGSRRHGLPGLSLVPRLALLALPAGAVVTGSQLFLRLVPAALQALLAALFVLSLRGGGSLFFDAARIVQPYAPDFIGPYCRKATLAFAALFAVQAVVLTAWVFRPPAHGWAAASSAVIWLPLAVLFAIEWSVRKAWFRHYGRHPLDRLLRVLLPPERTARGRRSLAYIASRRRELGLPPP
jgi:uncharacterized membrane protein